MGQDIIIRGNTYVGAETVDVPLANGQGNATFWDASGTNFTAADLRSGKKGVNANGEVVGAMTEKAAATYTPTGSSQSISANQFLAGAQTIEAVVAPNLIPANIVAGVVVKVGTASDDDSVMSVTGSAQIPLVQYDTTLHKLTIS